MYKGGPVVHAGGSTCDSSKNCLCLGAVRLWQFVPAVVLLAIQHYGRSEAGCNEGVAGHLALWYVGCVCTRPWLAPERCPCTCHITRTVLLLCYPWT